MKNAITQKTLSQRLLQLEGASDLLGSDDSNEDEITPKRVLRELLRVAESRFSTPSERLRALELLGRHAGLWKDDKDTGDDGKLEKYLEALRQV